MRTREDIARPRPRDLQADVRRIDDMPLPKPKDFSNRQMDLFRNLLCNSVDERDCLSNTFDLWDSIPRYVVSRQLQEKWRKADKFPPLYEVSFKYRGRQLTATIQPASVKGRDGVTRSYFPSANEELIEDVLRKIAAEQGNGYYDPRDRRSGVVFTLHMLRKELERRRHGRPYHDIVLSLEIMARSVIITNTSDGQEGDFKSNSLYLNNLFRASKEKLAEDPEAKWSADFHPFACQALDDLSYRQFNYARLMTHRNQLTRWLNKVLCLKYLNASFVNPFEMRLSTISRDSGLLKGYARHRDVLGAVDAAFNELTSCSPPLLGGSPDKELVRGARNKVVDVIYTLRPAREFVAEVKAASKRLSVSEESLGIGSRSRCTARAR
jgi:hypothetical protein